MQRRIRAWSGRQRYDAASEIGCTIALLQERNMEREEEINAEQRNSGKSAGLPVEDTRRSRNTGLHSGQQVSYLSQRLWANQLSRLDRYFKMDESISYSIYNLSVTDKLTILGRVLRRQTSFSETKGRVNSGNLYINCIICTWYINSI